MGDGTEGRLPRTFTEFSTRFPTLAEAHSHVNQSLVDDGPLDEVTAQLIKVGVCVGARLESALKSHVRRAMAGGATVEMVEQAIALGMTTVGFPATVAAWRWAHDQIDRDAAEG